MEADAKSYNRYYDLHQLVSYSINRSYVYIYKYWHNIGGNLTIINILPKYQQFIRHNLAVTNIQMRLVII